MDSQVEPNSSVDEAGANSNTNMPFKKVMDHLAAHELDAAKMLCLEHRFRPKLGQLLIASGRLSASDLDSLLVVHDAEGIKNVPMGKLLVIAGLLTSDELSQYFALRKSLGSVGTITGEFALPAREGSAEQPS